MKEILILANAYYIEWLKTHDPYQEDFFKILGNLLPDEVFGITTNNEIINLA